MFQARVDTSWTKDDLRTVILENSLLRVVILPEAGARIYHLVYKPLDTDLLWKHPRIRPARLPFGARYDDVWPGGWDELFPNNEPGVINGELFPDHGEIWSVEWDSETAESADGVSASFYCRTRISDVSIKKTVSLRSGEPKVRVSYSLKNASGTAIPILWNLHVAMDVSEHHRIEFPPMKVRVEPTYPGTLVGAPDKSSWPLITGPQGTVDLRKVPPASKKKLHFFYGLNLAEGWCGVINTHLRLACGLSFDRSVFPCCWLFGSFGGWRNLNVAVLEPSTGYPFSMERAIQNKTCAWLDVGQVIETSVIFGVAEGLASISGISPQGDIS